MALMNMVAMAGFIQPLTRLLAAQAIQFIIEHLANRRMNVNLSHRPEFAKQRLHEVYNTFTRGLLAYCCYCVGRGGWNAQISTACRTVARFENHHDNALAIADRFGRYIVGLWPELDRRNGWYYLRLDWDDLETGLRYLNLKVFFSGQIERYRNGGIHSAAWIADRIQQNLPLKSEDTQGLLYQDVLILGRISYRFDRYLGNGIRWHLTPAQSGVVANLRNSKAYAT